MNEHQDPFDIMFELGGVRSLDDKKRAKSHQVLVDAFLLHYGRLAGTDSGPLMLAWIRDVANCRSDAEVLDRIANDEGLQDLDFAEGLPMLAVMREVRDRLADRG